MNSINLKKLTSGDPRTLARAITLIESQNPKHRKESKQLLKKVFKLDKSSYRISISGAPGAGKSTLIEALGLHVIRSDHRIAVLTIDPTSPISGGSILGDKVRMEKLAANPNAFIRPSPTSLHAGGASHRTREVIQLCEAAGFDIIIVETVGVGQTEFQVKNMVDAFVLAISPLSGDSIQGMKKGILELADLIAITKCDGETEALAKMALSEFQESLQLQKREDEWSPCIMTISSHKLIGIPEMWESLQKYLSFKKSSGIFEKDRLDQQVTWIKDLFWESIHHRFQSKLDGAGTQKKILKMLTVNKMNPQQISEIILKNV